MGTNLGGRPLVYGEPVKKKTFSLQLSIVKWLEQKGNASRFVNGILFEKMEEEIKKAEAEGTGNVSV